MSHLQNTLNTLKISIYVETFNNNLAISSPISGVMLTLLLLILRASGVGAPSDLHLIQLIIRQL